MRGISRVFGVSRKLLSGWIKKKAQTDLSPGDVLLPAIKEDILELDELWSHLFMRKPTKYGFGWFNAEGLGPPKADSISLGRPR